MKHWEVNNSVCEIGFGNILFNNKHFNGDCMDDKIVFHVSIVALIMYSTPKMIKEEKRYIIL